MKKAWSISTTLRNPERIRNFLIAIKDLEGQKWDKTTQRRFQILLIQKKFYGAGSKQFYTGLPQQDVELLDGPEELDFETAERILDDKGYEGGGEMRGRQSFKPIEKMGLIQLDNESILRLTPLGKYLLREDYDLGEMFFKSFLKWQYPNPTSRDFNASQGYDVKPFIGTLHLINEVNKLSREAEEKEKGISMLEFRLFVPTLINYKDIKAQAKKLFEFRKEYSVIEKEKDKRAFVDSYVAGNFADFENADLDNLGDYADNTLRYFRMTRYLYIRGGGYYVDLEPRRSVEIQSLLAADNGASIAFELDDYNAYISDINLPVLPWETPDQLQKIIEETESDITKYMAGLEAKGLKIDPLIFSETKTKEEATAYVEALRQYRRSLQEKEDHFLSQNLDKIVEYRDRLKNIRNSREKKSVELEYLATQALNALNDALAIKPNYPVGDDNVPTFTAPGNRPDIECFYQTFNSICEVTMLTDRSQWYNEGQPVMRHIRDFETEHNEKETFCLFVAPSLHRDTINTFWTSIKYEYEGSKQRIVPMTIGQIIELLDVLIEIKSKGKRMEHAQIKDLYAKIVASTESVATSDLWIQQIPSIIKDWKANLVS